MSGEEVDNLGQKKEIAETTEKLRI